MSDLVRFSVVARCASGGGFGFARLSSSIGPLVAFDGAVAATAGAVAVHAPGGDAMVRLGSRLLSLGLAASHVSLELQGASPARQADAQWVVVDRDGSVSIRDLLEPDAPRGVAAPDVGVLWQGLAPSGLGAAAISAFESSVGKDLDERLLQTLEAVVGHLGREVPFRSTALLAWGRRDYSETDLRVDLHEDPVKEMRRIYEDFKPTAQYYEDRARNPGKAINAREFAGLLAKRRAQST